MGHLEKRVERRFPHFTGFALLTARQITQFVFVSKSSFTIFLISFEKFLRRFSGLKLKTLHNLVKIAKNSSEMNINTDQKYIKNSSLYILLSHLIFFLCLLIVVRIINKLIG